MEDRNISRMLWFGLGTVAALLVICGAQLYAGEADARAKRADCAEAYRGLTHRTAASPARRQEGSGDADQRNGGEEGAGDEERRVAAIAVCAAAAGLGSPWSSAIGIFLRTLGPFVGVMAFFLAGLRYDAGKRHAFGGTSSALEFAPRRGDSTVWKVRNVGYGPEIVEGVRVVDFPLDRAIAEVLADFELFREPWHLEPGETCAFETTKRGRDLLVAALIRRADGVREAIWARFRLIDGAQGHEQREEGRLRRW